MKSHASMNRIYRLVWNAALSLWVAVAENVKGRGKGGSARSSVLFGSAPASADDGDGGGSGFTLNTACRAALVLLTSLAVLTHEARAADAANASVTAGAGNVSTLGNTTTINQASQRLAIDWTSLSTRANEALVFNQPNAAAIALNRITGSSPSELLGSLTANGQVFILNPNGVLFGAGSQVNVGGLVASTLSLSNADFMAGNHVFTGSGGSGSVVNQGTLTAANGGYIALLAPEVRNEGVIAARLGIALLAAGNKVTLNIDNGNLLGYSIDQTAINALADNRHLIKADGGQVILTASATDALLRTVVNNSGVIEAKTLNNQGGVIRLEGGDSGVVHVSGTLDASGKGAGERGGKVEVTGDKVGLFDAAKVDVSGDAGGGTALIGGDFQGANAAVKNASANFVGADASVTADAITSGNGGKVIVWSDGITRYNGSISAKGGADSGNGGFVEVSGKGLLAFKGEVDTSAANGLKGTLLLDPTNIWIAVDSASADAAAGYAVGDTSADAGAGAPFAASGAVDDSLLTTASLTAALANNDVIITTENADGAGAGNITVVDAVTYTGTNTSTLALVANNNITINQSITSTNGALNVNAIAGAGFVGDISLANGAAINTNGGNVQLTGRDITIGNGSAIVAGYVQLKGSQDIIFDGTGTINATGDVYLGGRNIQQGGTGIAVTADKLSIRSTGYIGNSGAMVAGDDKLNTQVNTLSAVAPGAISISNTGALTVDAVTFQGMTPPNGGAIVGVSSTGGAISLATVDTGGATDNLTLNKSVTTTGGAANTINLQANDNYTQNAGAFVTTVGANATLSAGRALTINETGTAVSTSGANGAVDVNGQSAGSISIGTLGSTLASINILGNLSARGGAANNGSGNTSASSNAAFSGGSGGSVTLQTAAGNSNTITVGNIDAAGGNGAASSTGVYGVGGNGGAILIRSNGASSAIQTGHLSSSGAAPGYIGDGGHAGAVTVEGLGANSGVTTGNISAAGGIGSFQGQFALGASGGNGGNVTVNGKGNVTTGFIDAHGEGASANTGRNNLTTGRGGVIAVTASTGSSDVSTGALSSYSGDAFCNGNRNCTLQAAGNITVSSTGFIKIDGAVQAQGGNANGGNAPNNGAAAGNVSITSTATTSGKSILINGGINAAGGNGRGGNAFGSGASGGAAGSVTVSSAGVGGAGSNVAIAGGINALGGAASGTGAQAVAGASKAVNVTAADGYVWQAAGNYFNGASVAVTANRGIGAGSGALDMTGATAPDMSSRLGVAAVNSTARNAQGNFATRAGALRVTYAGGSLVLGTQFQNGFVPGDFDLAVPNGDLTLSGLGRTGSASVSLSTGGNLTLTNNGLISTVTGNIRLEAAGNIGVGNQARAETTSGDLYVYAGGNITQTNEYHSLVANNLAIRAGGAIGEGSGNGRLVTQANNLSLAAGGNVILYNNTALNIGSVTFGGATVPGGVINGASSSGGALWIGSGSTLSGTGPVTASSVSLSAAGGIDLGVDTASLSATDTSGPISITLANGGTVENVATTGTVNLTATAGDLNLKTVSGSDVTLAAAAGAITDANGTDNNITANTLTASSQNGIALGTDVSGLQTLSTSGATADISISTARAIDTANYSISTDSGSTQNVSLTSSSASGITVGNAFAATNDNISLTATAGDINLTSAIGAAGLALSAQGGISAPAAINVSGVFNLQAGTFSQVGTLPTFYAGDFRISGGTFVRALGGDGLSTGTAYQIADVYGLQGVGSADLLNKNFKLANNIDASGTVNWNGGAGFNPIASGAQFFGTLDGGGHVIDQLVINRPGDTDVGLISLMNGGTVSNLGLTGGSVTGDDNVGALVGRSIGTIINSHSSAAVNGNQRTGGLVGTNAGTISNSYASGDVSGSIYAGGLAGTNSGTVSGSYATGTVVGSNAGGLVGVNSNAISDSYASGAVGTASDHTTGGLAGINSGTITSSYANGLVQGSSETGGLVGWDNIGTVTASFWDTQTSGQAGSGGGGTGILTADMMKAQTFTGAGWNASNVGGDGTAWRIYEGHTGPLLRSFLTGLTLADTNATYNGGMQAGATTAVAGVSGSNASARNAGSYLTGYYSNQQGYDIIGGGLEIAKADLTLTTSDVTKTYDGTLSATGTAVAAAGTALLGGDTASGGSFAFTNKNVGTGNKTVTAAGVTVNDGNGGNNYNVSYADNTTSTINKADLTVTATGVTKTYDGTTSATGTGTVGTLAGAGAGEVVNAVGTQVFTDKNFGVGNKTVQAIGLTIKDSGNADVTGNYNISYVDNTTSTINKADLTVTATGVTKTYDGTTSATGTGSVGTLAGAAAGELVNAAATQVFTDKNAGTSNKTVQASGLTIKDSGNADVTGNYNIAYVDNTTSTINKADLSVTANSVTKTYDGTLSATGAGTVATLAGAGAGEMVDAAGSQAFLDKNFGIGNKAVRASGVTIKDSGNADVTGNYNIAYVDNTTGTINKANVTLSTSDVTKTYDGGLSASGTVVVTAGQVFLGDTTSGGAFAFTNKNAGNGNKTVETSGVTVGDGVNNANYNVTYADNTTSTINQANLVLTTNNVTKTYDGALGAAGTAAVSSGTVFSGDGISGGSFAFTDKNAGTGNKTVTTTGVTVNDGNGGNNYNVSYVDNTASTINKADLTVTATGVSKTYDGTTAATGTGTVAALAGAAAGEVVDAAGSQAFLDKNFGIGNKAVRASGVTIKDSGNADVTGNYNIAYVDNTSSTINKADVTVTATGVTKTYDGTTSATGTASVSILAGVGAGESPDSLVSQEFLDKNAGIGNKVVRAGAMTIRDSGNADVTGNYNITYVDNTTSTINQANLTLTTNNVTKTYDGTLGAAGTAAVASGTVFSGDSVTGGAFAFTDKNVGSGNKTVTTSGITVGDGVNNANYNITYADNTSSTINQANLTVTATGVTKTYDGTTNATGTGFVGTLAGAGAGESVNAAATQVFTDKNFGVGNKTVQASGLTIKDSGNADVTGNYAITYVDNTTSTINKADLTVTATGLTKTYDGTTAATGTGTVAVLAGAGAGEMVDAAGSQAFLDKNFGIGNKAVRASGVTIKDSGNADVTGNYNIAYVDDTTSTINKANLSLSTSDVTKTYDGDFFANGTVVVASGTVFAGDSTSGGAFSFIDKNVGTGNKTVVTFGVTVGDGVNNGNYNVSYVNNNTSTINQANLTLIANNVTKTYDGTVAASGSAAVSSGTLFAGDSLTGGSFAFTDKNAGIGNKTVTASGVTVGDGFNNGNYNVTYADNTTSTINKANLTVTADAVTKTYDGTLAAAGSGTVGTLAGAGAGEVVNAAATQAFTDKNFGIGNKTVQASGLTIKDSGNADVTGNYNISYVDNTASTINKADVTLATSDVTKTYDGGLSASGTVVVTAGQVFLGDNTSGGSFAFTDKNAGSGNKTVTTSGVTVGDGVNNANYNVSYANNTTSTIDQANLTLSTSNVTKTYDGNTTAAGSVTVTGGALFAGDGLTGGSFAFADKNAGNGNKTVQTSGVTVGDGVNNGNYAVTYADNTTSTINPFAVSVSGTRTYDGTADVAAGVLNIGPLVGSETLGLSGLATMADKNVGANKTLTVAGLGLVDGSGMASNYTFTGGTQQASITQASLTVGSSNVTKTYDATTTAAGTATVTGGTLFSGDNLTGGTFAFTDKNAGAGNKTVTAAGVTVGDGVNNGNYAVTYANNTTSSINKADLTVTASGVDKVYDGTTAATVGYGDNRLGSDVLSVTGAASFADKNADTGKSVGVNGIALGGTDAGNYNLLNTTTTTTASITPKALTVTANGDSKLYDGSAYSGGNGVSYNGFVAGDSASDIGGSLAYGGSSQGAIATGNYLITAGGLSSISGNYALGFVDGALSIKTSNASTVALGNAGLVSLYDSALTALAGLGGSSGGGGFSGGAAADALAAAAAEAGNTGEE